MPDCEDYVCDCFGYLWNRKRINDLVNSAKAMPKGT